MKKREFPPFWATTVRTALLGATLGIAAGFVEAALLRLALPPVELLKPEPKNIIWFADPLAVSLIFGLLGLFTGLLVAWLRDRLPGIALLAALAGLAGAYLAAAVRFTQDRSAWYWAHYAVIRPSIAWGAIFLWVLGVLWAARAPGSGPFGPLAKLRLRPCAAMVLGIMAVLGLGTLISAFRRSVQFEAPKANAASPVGRPNIVLIVWDTVRADHLSSYGYKRPTTPHLDRLAARGVLFENAIAPSSWTLPSFASMFTGLLPHQHGASQESVLEGSPRTLAEILQTRGYETAGFNANPYFGLTEWGIAQGFETYEDNSSLLAYNLAATVMGRSILEPAYQSWIRYNLFNRHNAHEVNRDVYRWFRRRSNRPFFLMVNYFDAHRPYAAPAPYEHLYGRAPLSLLRDLNTTRTGFLSRSPTEQERESLIGVYDNCIAYLDSQMEELLRFLSSTPEWSNTFVIITSDHGESFGDHKTYDHGWNLYREALHVPLVILGPQAPAGLRIPHIVDTRELFSTVLDFAAMPDAIFRRTSLRRFWTPGFQPTPFDDFVISELLDYRLRQPKRGFISLVTPDWHYIRLADGHSSLYAWPSDPAERNDLMTSPDGQQVSAGLDMRLQSMVESSVRPWRGLRYLLAVEGPNFSAEKEARRVISRKAAETNLSNPEIGAEQIFFYPDSLTIRYRERRANEELLRSLPYN